MVSALALLLAAPALLAQDMTAHAHARLDRTMFWTGALFALTPVVLALTVFGVVWWHRRRDRAAQGEAGASVTQPGPDERP